MCVPMDDLDGSDETVVRQATERPRVAGRGGVADFVAVPQARAVRLHGECEEGTDESRRPKAGPGDGASAWR